MKQLDMFGKPEKITPEEEEEQGYTQKIKSPIYKPSAKKPHPLELFNDFKTNKLIRDIKASNVEELEKRFLIEAARRHTVFHYDKIADYYAHATPEMQSLMEDSALIIIDFNKAIRKGYVKLTKEIAELYTEEYGE